MMTFFIKKSVLSISICLFILFVGSISLYHLPFRLMPKINMPVVNVETEYPGASAEIVQHTLTSLLQNAFFDLQGIDYIESSSVFGKSNISIHFKIGQNSNLLLNDVSNKIHCDSLREEGKWVDVEA